MMIPEMFGAGIQKRSFFGINEVNIYCLTYAEFRAPGGIKRRTESLAFLGSEVDDHPNLWDEFPTEDRNTLLREYREVQNLCADQVVERLGL